MGGKIRELKWPFFFSFFAENDYLCSVFLPSYIETVSFKSFKIFSFALSITALSKESK